MSSNAEKVDTFKINLTYINYATAIIPLLVMVIDGILFYSLGHYKLFDYIPTISEMNVVLPESRIFGMRLSFTAILFDIFAIFRFHIITFYQARHKNGFRKLILIMKILMICFMVVASLGMIVFSTSPVTQYRNTHNFSAGLYFICIFIYFVIDDFICSKLNRPPKLYSRIATWSIIMFLILYIFVRRLGTKSSKKIRYSISSVFEIIGIFLQIVKLLILIHETPKYHLIGYNPVETFNS